MKGVWDKKVYFIFGPKISKSGPTNHITFQAGDVMNGVPFYL